MRFTTILEGIIARSSRRAVSMIKNANRFIDEREAAFKKGSPGKKVGSLFALAAAATVMPGGYTVIPALYIGRKLYRMFKHNKN